MSPATNLRSFVGFGKSKGEYQQLNGGGGASAASKVRSRAARARRSVREAIICATATADMEVRHLVTFVWRKLTGSFLRIATRQRQNIRDQITLARQARRSRNVCRGISASSQEAQQQKQQQYYYDEQEPQYQDYNPY